MLAIVLFFFLNHWRQINVRILPQCRQAGAVHEACRRFLKRVKRGVLGKGTQKTFGGESSGWRQPGVGKEAEDTAVLESCWRYLCVWREEWGLEQASI